MHFSNVFVPKIYQHPHNTEQNAICRIFYVRCLSSPLTWGHHSLREAWPSHRSDRVAVDVVFASLDCQGVGQAQQAQLGRAVVGLAEVTVDARGRSCHDDSDHKSGRRKRVRERRGVGRMATQILSMKAEQPRSWPLYGATYGVNLKGRCANFQTSWGRCREWCITHRHRTRHSLPPSAACWFSFSKYPGYCRKFYAGQQGFLFPQTYVGKETTRRYQWLFVLYFLGTNAGAHSFPWPCPSLLSYAKQGTPTEQGRCGVTM